MIKRQALEGVTKGGTLLRRVEEICQSPENWKWILIETGNGFYLEGFDEQDDCAGENEIVGIVYGKGDVCDNVEQFNKCKMFDQKA